VVHPCAMIVVADLVGEGWISLRVIIAWGSAGRTYVAPRIIFTICGLDVFRTRYKWAGVQYASRSRPLGDPLPGGGSREMVARSDIACSSRWGPGNSRCLHVFRPGSAGTYVRYPCAVIGGKGRSRAGSDWVSIPTRSRKRSVTGG